MTRLTERKRILNRILSMMMAIIMMLSLTTSVFATAPTDPAENKNRTEVSDQTGDENAPSEEIPVDPASETAPSQDDADKPSPQPEAPAETSTETPVDPSKPQSTDNTDNTVTENTQNTENTQSTENTENTQKTENTETAQTTQNTAAASQPDPVPVAEAEITAAGKQLPRLTVLCDRHRIRYFDSVKQPLPEQAELNMGPIDEDDIPLYLHRAAHALGMESCGMYLYLIADPLIEDAETADVLRFTGDADDPDDRMTVEITIYDDEDMTDEEKAARLQDLQDIHIEDLQVILLGSSWDNDVIAPHSYDEETGVIRFLLEDSDTDFILFIPDYETAVYLDKEDEEDEVPDETPIEVGEGTKEDEGTQQESGNSENLNPSGSTEGDTPAEGTTPAEGATKPSDENPGNPDENPGENLETVETSDGTLTAEGSDYSVSLTYTNEPNVPEDSSLELSEVSENGILHESLTDVAAVALHTDSENILSVTFVDLDVKSEGESVNLDNTVDVSITVNNPPENSDYDIQVLSLGAESAVLKPAEPEAAAAEDASETGEGETGESGIADEPAAPAAAAEATTTFVTSSDDLTSTYAIVRIYKQVKLKASDDRTYLITVAYDRDDPGIPDTAELAVDEITKDDERYEDYVAQSNETTGANPDKLTFARAFDIRLIDTATGDECRPAGEVAVSIQLMEEDMTAENTKIEVVHFGEEPEKVDCTLNDETGAVEFAASGFSVYLVTSHVIETVYRDCEGETWKITATYDSDSGIPETAELVVTELAERTEAFDEYLSQSTELTGTDPEKLKFAKAFDIKLIDSDTGKECQPTKDVKITIELQQDQVNEYSKVDVVHFGDNDKVEQLDCALNKDNAIEFTTPGFSVFFVTGYTVDFHWGDYVYSIAGESEVLLSEVFEKLNISEVSVKDVEDVAFSNPELLTVTKVDSDTAKQIKEAREAAKLQNEDSGEVKPEEIPEEVPEEAPAGVPEEVPEETPEENENEAEEQAEYDWLLKSLAPFDSDETLTLTLKNDQAVEIKVTDATYICKVDSQRFTTLNDALIYIRSDKSGTGKIEMLTNYVMPASDTVTIGTSDNITLTTANDVTKVTIIRGSDNTASMFTNNGTFTIENVILDGGNTGGLSCEADGGIVYVAAGTLNLNSGVTLQNSTVNGNGGIVYVAAGTLDLNSGATLQNSSASGDGGAIYVYSGADMTVTGTSASGISIIDCIATNSGGAIYYDGGNNLSITGLTINGHDQSKAEADRLPLGTFNAKFGGGIYLNSGTLSLSDSSIYNCIITNTVIEKQKGADDKIHHGAAIYCKSDDPINDPNNVYAVTINNSIFDGCFGFSDNSFADINARDGGAIYMNVGSLYASDMTVQNWKVYNKGGGLYTYRGNMTLVGCTIQNCANVNVDKSGGSSQAVGGGIQYGGREAGLVDNKMLIIDNTRVINNESMQQGAGVFTRGNITLKNGSEISGNILYGTDAQNAAGVYIADGKKLILGDENQINPETSTITNNTLSDETTASNVRLSEKNNFNSPESVVIKKELGTACEIRVVNAKTIFRKFGTIESTAAVPLTVTNIVSDDTDERLWGAVAENDSTSLVWRGEPECKIVGGDNDELLYYSVSNIKYPAAFMKLSDAFAALGNSFTDAADIVKTPAKILMLRDNHTLKTPVSGSLPISIILSTETRTSGVDFPYDGENYPPSCTITRASGTQNNSMIYLSASDSVTLTLENITLDGGKNNGVASGTGSILKAWTNVSITLGEKCVLQYNESTNPGGAISAQLADTIVTLRDGAKISSCKSDSDGGAIYIQDGQLIVTKSNEYASDQPYAIIENCTAGGNGGGIYYDGCDDANIKLILDGGMITGNSASNQGGGLYINNGSVVLKHNASITGNTLTSETIENAAGIYMNAGTMILGEEGATTAEVTSVTGNTASNGKASDVRLPETDGFNNIDSINIVQNFQGFIGVVNPNGAFCRIGDIVNEDYLQDPTGQHRIYAEDGSELYGMVDPLSSETEKKIIWQGEVVCRITDKDGKLLGKPDGRVAVYGALLDAFTAFKAGGFINLQDQESAVPVNIEMLVEDVYEMTKPVGTEKTAFTSITAVLKTAPSYQEDEIIGNPEQYRRKEGATGPCRITRSNDFSPATDKMFVFGNDANVTLTNITIGGTANEHLNAQLDGVVFHLNGTAQITLGDLTTIQYVDNNVADKEYGYCLQAEGTAQIVMQGTSTIQHCSSNKNGVVGIGKTAVLEMKGSAKIDSCTTTGNGGGINSLGTVKISEQAQVLNCIANNGGGIYSDGSTSNLTINGQGTVVTGCTAAKGGGIFINSGTITLKNGAAITGNKLNSTTQTDGGGIYMNSGTLVLGGNEAGDLTDETASVTGNTTSNGRVASDVRLPETKINNATINTNNGINIVKNFQGFIGVVNPKVAFSRFGIIANKEYLKDPTTTVNGKSHRIYGEDSSGLYAVVDPTGNVGNEKIIWQGNAVCKITDIDGNLLTFNNGNTDAVYPSLLAAFKDFKNKSFYGGKTPKYIKMLVATYSMDVNGVIDNTVFDITTGSSRKSVILTTESTDYNGPYPYVWDPETEGTRCTIIRSSAFKKTMFTVPGTLTIENLIVDGKDLTEDYGQFSGMFVIEAGGLLTLSDGAELKNGRAQKGNSTRSGGVFVREKASLIMEGSKENPATIHDCIGRSNGAVYVQHNASFTMQGYARIYNCRAQKVGNSAGGNGGAVTVGFDKKPGTFILKDHAMIENCSAQLCGGAVYLENSEFYMGGNASITGCSSEGANGGAVNFFYSITDNETKDTKIVFFGSPRIYDNLKNGEQKNVVLDWWKNNVNLIQAGYVNTTQGSNNSEGLTGGKIGIYVIDSNNLMSNHGVLGKDFGIWNNVDNTKNNLSAFINDRNNLVGTASNTSGDNKIYWGEGASYIKLQNDTATKLYAKVIINDGAYRDKIYKHGSQHQSPISGVDSENKHYYVFKIASTSDDGFNRSETLYLPASVGASFTVELYKDEALKNKITSLSSENLSVHSESTVPFDDGETNPKYDFHGELFAGPSYSVKVREPGKETLTTIETPPTNGFRDDWDYKSTKNDADNCYVMAVNEKRCTIIHITQPGQQVAFRKLNGYGNGLDGAVFTLYKEPSCEAELILDDVDPVTSTTKSVTVNNEQGTFSGIVLFEKVPEGVWYMKETASPEYYEDDDTVYAVVVGKYYMTADKLKSAKPTQFGNYSDQDLQNALDAQNNVQWQFLPGEATPEEKEAAQKNYAIFTMNKDGEGNPTTAALGSNIVQYGCWNTSSIYRRVVLKKVESENHQPLAGATFTIYNRNMDTRIETAPTSDSTTANGAVWAGRFPLGIYYLEESGFPSGYEKDQHQWYYEMNVRDDNQPVTITHINPPVRPQHVVRTEGTSSGGSSTGELWGAFVNPSGSEGEKPPEVPSGHSVSFTYTVDGSGYTFNGVDAIVWPVEYVEDYIEDHGGHTSQRVTIVQRSLVFYGNELYYFRDEQNISYEELPSKLSNNSGAIKKIDLSSITVYDKSTFYNPATGLYDKHFTKEQLPSHIDEQPYGTIVYVDTDNQQVWLRVSDGDLRIPVYNPDTVSSGNWQRVTDYFNIDWSSVPTPQLPSGDDPSGGEDDAKETALRANGYYLEQTSSWSGNKIYSLTFRNNSTATLNSVSVELSIHGNVKSVGGNVTGNINGDKVTITINTYGSSVPPYNATTGVGQIVVDYVLVTGEGDFSLS